MKTDVLCFSALSYKDALDKMAKYSIRLRYVKKSFTEALLKREENFPTGLYIPSCDYALAIPHTDSKHALKDVFLFGVPRNTIKFRNMENPKKWVDAELIILFIIKQMKGYTSFLARLVELFQDEEFSKLVKDKEYNRLINLVINKCTRKKSIT